MTLTVENVLDEQVSINYGDPLTVRQYFAQVLLKLWGNEEEFNGYRPFGNSEWGYEDICSPIAVRHDLGWQEVENLVREALLTKF